MKRRGVGRPGKDDLRDGRESILRAAGDLVEEQGMERLTIRNVAERAGVGTALVSYYFKSKQGLKEAVAFSLLREEHRHIASSLEGQTSAAEQLHQAIVEFITHMGRKPRIARLVLDLVFAGDQEVLRRLVSEVARANLELLSRVLHSDSGRTEFKDPDVALLTPLIMGSAIYPVVMAPVLLALMGLDLRQERDLERYAHHTARLLVAGLRQLGKGE